MDSQYKIGATSLKSGSNLYQETSPIPGDRIFFTRIFFERGFRPQDYVVVQRSTFVPPFLHPLQISNILETLSSIDIHPREEMEQTEKQMIGKYLHGERERKRLIILSPINIWTKTS